MDPTSRIVLGLCVKFVTAHRMIAVKSSQQNVSFELNLTVDFDTATLRFPRIHATNSFYPYIRRLIASCQTSCTNFVRYLLSSKSLYTLRESIFHFSSYSLRSRSIYFHLVVYAIFYSLLRIAVDLDMADEITTILEGTSLDNKLRQRYENWPRKTSGEIHNI